MTEQKFTLRTLQPSDSPAVVKLINDFGGDMTTRFLIDAYTAIISGSEYRTIGVVAEAAGTDGIVGMGTVRFSMTQFNGQVLPLAFLDNLKVRADFRGQGLGFQIASWRIHQAREAFGDQGVIATGMLQNNLASRGVARKWCREFIEPINVFVMPVRSRAPKLIPGITVREIEIPDYEAFADKQNAFYKDYNLYKPVDPDTITALLDASPGGKKPYRLWIAVDASGNLLAGAQTWFRGLLKTDTINQPPRPLRMMNRLLHLLPPDFAIRDVAVSGLWAAPGRLQLAQHLWEIIRWQFRDQATTIMTGFDPHDPTRAVVQLKPWHQPRPKIAIAIHGPAPTDRSKLLFSQGRV